MIELYLPVVFALLLIVHLSDSIPLNPTSCPGGYEFDEFSARCTPCGPGFYSSGGNVSCLACSPGTFQPMGLATNCIPALPGDYKCRVTSFYSF